MPIFAKIFSVLLLAIGISGCATPMPCGLEAPGHSRAFGPFYESTHRPDGTEILALRPVYHRTRSERQPQQEIEWLWPLASFREGRAQRNWRVLTWFGTDYDRNDPDSKSRVWLLPFWFHGRNTQGEPYWALFPLGGRIDHIAGIDRVNFVLFPLYMRRQTLDIEQVSVFWPLYARITSPPERGIEGLHLFPVFGYSQRREDWARHYALWPIWNHARYGPGSRDPGTAWMLFPLVGWTRTERQRGGYLLPPFVSYLSREAEGYRRVHAPWPFVQIQDGTVYKRMFWPLYGTRQTDVRRMHFVGWPLFWRDTIVFDGARQRRHRLIPFLEHVRVRECDTEREISRYLQVWPLFVSRRSENQHFFRTLDLWPGNLAGFDRNWAPFWTLYQRREINQHVAVDALWGIWRTRRLPDGSHAGRLWPLLDWRGCDEPSDDETGQWGWRLLRGLVGYQRDAEGAHMRLFWMTFPRRSRADADTPQEDAMESERET